MKTIKRAWPRWTAILLTVFGLTGCGSRTWTSVPDGATGMYLDAKRVAFPNEKGELVEGEYEPRAGDLLRKPKTNEERLDALRKAGVTILEKP